MKNKSYLDYIDHLIKQSEDRLVKLRSARDIVAEIADKVREPVVAPEVQPQPGGMITIQRTIPTKTGVGRGGNQNRDPKLLAENKVRREAMRKTIVGALDRGEQVSSTDLIKEFGLENAPKERRQDVYQTLYDLKKEGYATREEGSMVYRKAETALPDTSETSH